MPSSFSVKGSILCVAILSAAIAPAQDARAKVQGLVTDTSNAVVAGATVLLRNDNTAVQAQQLTNQAGQYLFDFVAPGNYTVTIELTGFKQFIQRNVLV